MVSLTVVFATFVILFAVIGAMRGWAKELLVTSAVVLALFINAILENYIEPYRAALLFQPGGTQFLIRAALVLVLAIFGYQTPRFHALEGKVAKERLQDMLLGVVLGALNGYLLLGTLWYYLHQAGYPSDLIVRPEPGSDLDVQIANLVPFLPPGLLPIPHVYFAVGIVFVFVIVVFV